MDEKRIPNVKRIPNAVAHDKNGKTQQPTARII
jgi:hypothetical protein